MVTLEGAIKDFWSFEAISFLFIKSLAKVQANRFM